MAEYLAFHYLEPRVLVPRGITPPRGVTNFPFACARLLLTQAKNKPQRALDLGCAVGRSTFELSRKVPQVVGIDFSRSFIQAAQQLQKKGRLPFDLLEEGKRSRRSLAQAPGKILRQRVSFLSGDALRLPKGLGTFDLLLAANLIDRLPHPKRFLSQILPSLINSGGKVLLTSPYTWTTEYTPASRWLGSPSIDSFSALQKILRPSFRLIDRTNLPFLLRETRRKFQYTFADATIWQKL